MPSSACSRDRLDHRRVAVAEQQRAVAAEVVDVLVAVDVPLARAFGAGGIDGIGQQRAAVVRQAGRDDLARALVQLGGAARAGAEFGLDLGVGAIRKGRLSHQSLHR